MANKRIDQLTATASVSLTDLLEKERDPAGAKAHEKVTLQQFVDFLVGYIGGATFATTAAIKASTSLQDGRIYWVLGDTLVGDGLSRAYRYDASDASPVEVGLLILIPNIIVRPATGSLIKVDL